MTNLPVDFINSEQPGVSEQFCDDQKVPYHQVRLYQTPLDATTFPKKVN